MYCNTFADARGLVDRRAKLRFAVLIRSGQLTVMDRIRPGLVDFDEVRALLELLANHGDQFIRVVCVSRIRQDVLLRVEADRVLVTAKNVYGVAADPHSWPRNFAAINRVTYGAIGGARTFRPHVALSGEASHQIVTSAKRCHDGALWH